MDLSFKDFMKMFTEHSNEMFKSADNLFVVGVDKDEIWNKYLDSFAPEKNPMYRVRREYDCSCCKSFIRQFGNVVAIKNNKIITLWDFSTGDETFEPVLRGMESFLKERAVEDGFVTKTHFYGEPQTNEVSNGKVISWNHFHITIPSKFVESSGHTSVSEIKSVKRDIRNVFSRSLEEIDKDAVQTVLDMIDEGQLYRGEEWKQVLEKFQTLQKSYAKLKTKKEKENFTWAQSFKVGGAVGKIRNHSIGTLLTDISNGVDIDEAVRKYEVIVAPSNYKRPKPVFSKKMVEDAEKTLVSLGLQDSLGRRFAKITDITINNVLWANRNAEKAMKSRSVFDDLKSEAETVSPKKFENMTGVSITDFLKQLPSIKSLKILFENRHSGNLVSLIAPENPESPSLFKWDNAFSWAYNGNVTDSMKERVKMAGGNVDGVLRFSLQWNDSGVYNPNDFDAHCIEPNGNHIYFASKGQRHRSTGILDVDIIHPQRDVPAVENISWSSLTKMPNGEYQFYVNNYSHNGGRDGFSAEIEFDGDIYEFHYEKELKQKENVQVAVVKKTASGFKMMSSLASKNSKRTLWNVDTNSFINVSTVMFSPNYWDEKEVGNRHYFFMMNECINDTRPNGFYNEYLKEDFTRHRKVFEALGSKMKVEDSDTQLSGLGFSSTKRDFVIVKADDKIMKIIF